MLTIVANQMVVLFRFNKLNTWRKFLSGVKFDCRLPLMFIFFFCRRKDLCNNGLRSIGLIVSMTLENSLELKMMFDRRIHQLASLDFKTLSV